MNPPHTVITDDRLLTVRDVLSRVHWTRSTLYRRLADDSDFPQAIRLGPRSVRFSERELNGWIAARRAAS